MLLVNKHGVVHDATDEIGVELLASEQGFRRATPDEEKAYSVQVAKSSPRYLARMNARREELDKQRNKDIDRLIDEEIAKEESVIASEAGQTLEERGGRKAEQPEAPKGNTVNPDELELEDSEIKPLTTEADVQPKADTSERRRRRE